MKTIQMIPMERIASKIYLMRGMKVMLDRDLAELYEVETKRLKEQVRRNIERFPEDFMFELTQQELENWRSQFATSNQDVMGLRIKPFAFTEHGILMLSSVLKSQRAVQVNIQIMRAFTKLRHSLIDNEDFRRELDKLKQVTEERFQIVFETLDQLLTSESKPKKKIGFTVKEKQKAYGKNKKVS
jgi:phage regulator Rha-like protein